MTEKPTNRANKPTGSLTPTTRRRTPSHDEISERAYFIHLEGEAISSETGCVRSASWRRPDHPARGSLVAAGVALRGMRASSRC
jgi:hypothetical protein